MTAPLYSRAPQGWKARATFNASACQHHMHARLALISTAQADVIFDSDVLAAIPAFRPAVKDNPSACRKHVRLETLLHETTTVELRLGMLSCGTAQALSGTASGDRCPSLNRNRLRGTLPCGRRHESSRRPRVRLAHKLARRRSSEEL